MKLKLVIIFIEANSGLFTIRKLYNMTIKLDIEKLTKPKPLSFKNKIPNKLNKIKNPLNVLQIYFFCRLESVIFYVEQQTLISLYNLTLKKEESPIKRY